MDKEVLEVRFGIEEDNGNAGWAWNKESASHTALTILAGWVWLA